MNNITTIYIVRHGESEGNANFDQLKRVEVHTKGGTSLTEKGRQQAEMVAKRLEKVSFDAVYSSDLNRAIQTAEIIALNRKIAVETTEILRERSFSHFANHFPDKTYEELTAELRRDLDKLSQQDRFTYKHSEHMESADEQATRILTFIREVAVANPGKTLLVVNHGNNMRSLLTKLGYATFDELPGGAVENTDYIVLETDGSDVFVKETVGVTKTKGKFRTY